MARHPDRYYQRFTRPYCQCEANDHGHTGMCRSRRYLVVHHKDHVHSGVQDKENLITLCSSCHRKEHRQQSQYFGRGEHRSWAETASKQLQQRLLEKEIAEERSGEE